MNRLIIWGGRLLPVFLIFTLVSCHSAYVSLDYQIYPHACYNDDSSLVAFVATKKAYLKPKGIARFPDGGQSKVIYRKADLYIFVVENNNLLTVWQLDDFYRAKDYMWHHLKRKCHLPILRCFLILNQLLLGHFI